MAIYEMWNSCTSVFPNTYALEQYKNSKDDKETEE